MAEGVLFLYDSVIDRNQLWKKGIQSLFQMLKKRGIPFLIMTRVQEQQDLVGAQILEEANCYPIYYKDDRMFHKAAQQLDLDIERCIVVSDQKESREESLHQIPAAEKSGYDLMYELLMQLI